MAGISNVGAFGPFLQKPPTIIPVGQMTGISITIPSPAPLTPDLAAELVQIAVSDVKRHIATGTSPDGTKFRPLKYPRPNGGDQPLRDTGALMASITGASTPTEIVVSTNRVGARLQHYGGIVRPKKAKVLTIPLTKEAKRAQSPRRLSRTGDIPLFAKRVNGQWVGHFLCVKQVTIPPRPFMGISKDGLRMLASATLDAIGKQWSIG